MHTNWKTNELIKRYKYETLLFFAEVLICSVLLKHVNYYASQIFAFFTSDLSVPALYFEFFIPCFQSSGISVKIFCIPRILVFLIWSKLIRILKIRGNDVLYMRKIRAKTLKYQSWRTEWAPISTKKKKREFLTFSGFSFFPDLSPRSSSCSINLLPKSVT